MIVWVLLALSASAEPVDERRVLTALRAIAYDRKLPDRAGPRVDLSVVYGVDAADAEQIIAILRRLGSLTLHDRPVDARSVAASVFLSETSPVDVVLVITDCGSRVSDIAAAANRRGALTVGFTLEDIERGAALVVVDGPDRLRLIVDQSSARDAGASFSSQLLQLAEVRP